MRRTITTTIAIAAAVTLTACGGTDAESTATPETVVVTVTAQPETQTATEPDIEPATETSVTRIPAAKPETTTRGALSKQLGEPFGILDANGNKIVEMTLDRIQRITPAECENYDLFSGGIDDPGAGFALMDLTVTTFDHQWDGLTLLAGYDWHTVDSDGRVVTESGMDDGAMSCMMSDGQDLSSMMTNAVYGKRVVVAIPAGASVVGYEFSSAGSWEWVLPTV